VLPRETTKRGGAPSPATLDREIELLKLVLNHAVTMKKLNANSLAGVGLLKKNVRKVVREPGDGRALEGHQVC
jgi:hypothetical protein